jgi:putative DNA primase/helicase
MIAAEIAAVLGYARREGRGWRCRCPLHGGRSLVLCDGENGRVLATCWGGCDRRHVLEELRSRGLWKHVEQGIVEGRSEVKRKHDPDDAKRTQMAIAIWESAVPASGTPVQIYLGSRGLDLPPTDVLRFHAGLKHPSGSVCPAMVALVTNGADPERT